MEPPPAMPMQQPPPQALPSPPSPELLARVDDDVKEYLLYRGFTGAINAFEGERQDDRLKAFDVEKVLAQIDAFVRAYDVGGLLAFWEFLDRRLFSHLDAHHAREMHKMKVALLRYYVVYCVKTERRDKAIEFLAEHTLSHGPSTPSSGGAGVTGGARGPSPSGIPPQLQAETDAAWRQWFVLPHLRDPTRDPQFHVFFSSSWADTLRVSLRNVLTVILHAVPPPKLLTLRAQEKGTQALRAELARARQELGDGALRARALEKHCLALTGAVEALLGRLSPQGPEGGSGQAEAETALKQAVAALRSALDQPPPPSEQQQGQQRGQKKGSNNATVAIDEAVAALTARVAAWAGVVDGKEEKGGGSQSQPQEEEEEEEEEERVEAR